MSDSGNFITIEGNHTTARVFVGDESDLNRETHSQLYDIVNHPAFDERICVMPDVHAGAGVVVGFSMPLSRRIIPEVVGGDIGCGMRAWRLGSRLPLSHEERDQRLREQIPGGGRERASVVDIDDYPYDAAMGVFREFKSSYEEKMGVTLSPPFEFEGYSPSYAEQLFERANIAQSSVLRDIGTLGGGNHFIEFGQSVRTNEYWLVIHSGSRRLGKAVAKYWQEQADSQSSRLGWLEGEAAHGYFVDMIFCQQFAVWNRRQMGEAALDVLGISPEETFGSTHNYVDFDDLIIRKGATRSYEGERIVIPLDVANGILICEGTGNPDANWSAPHGAGRVLSRSEAKTALTPDDFKDAVGDVYATNIDQSLVSEAPQAYKEPDFLLEQLGPLATPIDHLEPVHSIKHR